jgi:hypothetical protein
VYRPLPSAWNAITRRSGHASAAPSALGRPWPIAPPVWNSMVCGAALERAPRSSQAGGGRFVHDDRILRRQRRQRATQAISGSSGWLAGTKACVGRGGRTAGASSSCASASSARAASTPASGSASVRSAAAVGQASREADPDRQRRRPARARPQAPGLRGSPALRGPAPGNRAARGNGHVAPHSWHDGKVSIQTPQLCYGRHPRRGVQAAHR